MPDLRDYEEIKNQIFQLWISENPKYKDIPNVREIFGFGYDLNNGVCSEIFEMNNLFQNKHTIGEKGKERLEQLKSFYCKRS